MANSFADGIASARIEMEGVMVVGEGRNEEVRVGRRVVRDVKVLVEC